MRRRGRRSRQGYSRLSLLYCARIMAVQVQQQGVRHLGYRHHFIRDNRLGKVPL